MRLIDVDTLELREFNDAEKPPYVVLSHRWTKDEISYKEMLKNQNLDSIGYKKVLNFCKFVKSYDIGDWTFEEEDEDFYHTDIQYLRTAHDASIVYIPYVWIDTVCIDKRSSAELSEAINSMWTYYKYSSYCVVYLRDVPSLDDEGETMSALEESEWFDRGWTLQELLAPTKLFFLNAEWSCFGITASQHHIPTPVRDVVHRRTRIPHNLIPSGGSLANISAAQKLSWAANRKTTRGEDRSYSLFGLLGVNMPLLYGEGATKAFSRLQKEFILQYDDESIFAWCPKGIYRPMEALAPSLDCFARSGNVIVPPKYQSMVKTMARPPYDITNKGLRFQGSALRCEARDGVRFIVPLNCGIMGGDEALTVPTEQRNYVSCFMVVSARFDGSHTRWPTQSIWPSMRTAEVIAEEAPSETRESWQTTIANVQIEEKKNRLALESLILQFLQSGPGRSLSAEKGSTEVLNLIIGSELQEGSRVDSF